MLGQKGGQVAHGLLGLASHAAGDDRTVLGADLTGHDQPRAGLDNRRIRADGA